jgi:transcriptional regulator with XRE-family HTH domain
VLLRAVIDGLSQAEAASALRLSQPHISALRRGRYEGFSAGRLARLIASQHFDIEVHLRRLEVPYARPCRSPTIIVIRYDRYGRPANLGALFSKNAESPSAKSAPSATRASSSSSRSSW